MEKYLTANIEKAVGKGLTDQLVCTYLNFVESNALNTFRFSLADYIKTYEPELDAIL